MGEIIDETFGQHPAEYSAIPELVTKAQELSKWLEQVIAKGRELLEFYTAQKTELEDIIREAKRDPTIGQDILREMEEVLRKEVQGPIDFLSQKLPIYEGDKNMVDYFIANAKKIDERLREILLKYHPGDEKPS